MSQDPIARWIRRSTLRLLLAAVALSGFAALAVNSNAVQASDARPGPHADGAGQGKAGSGKPPTLQP